jgi:hypothetical protein
MAPYMTIAAVDIDILSTCIEGDHAAIDTPASCMEGDRWRRHRLTGVHPGRQPP